MRPLREINWWQLVNSYRWFREHDYLPKELIGYTTYGHTKEKYVELFAYIIEHLSEEKLKWLPDRFEQLYNWIFMDEHISKKRRGYKSSFKQVIKNSRFGSSEGTQAYIIDEMLLEQKKYSTFAIAKAIGSTEGRVRRHINHLRSKFKAEIEILTLHQRGATIYYLKERKKENVRPTTKSRKLTVQSIDGTEIRLNSSKSKRYTKKNSKNVL